MKKIVYGILILIVVVATILLIIKFSDDEEKPVKKEECHSISGGSFSLVFNTDSENSLSSIHVCIACPPDAYVEIPVVQKEGYIFDGWYYDKELTKKVNATTTLDITPQPIYEQEKCIVGYKDVTLYAKWNMIDKPKN